jgi:AGZA family xanthine/uracil permease-like MFS transporter
LLPGYALGFLIGSFGLVFLAAAPGQSRRPNRRHRARLRQQRARHHRVHAVDHAAGLSGNHDANRAWEIGAAAVVWTGIIKLAAAPFAGFFRRFIPQPASMTVFGAAMYSYLALVLLQRVFDQPLVGLIALAIIATASWPTYRSLAGAFHRSSRRGSFRFPSRSSSDTFARPGPAYRSSSLSPPQGTLRAMALAIPYLSVIAPIAIYQVLQDIASVAGAAAAGDDYDVRAVLACDGLGTLVSASPEA